MTLFITEVHAEIPNAVQARKLLASDQRTKDLALHSHGGSERSVAVSVQASDRAIASGEAIALVRAVLGEVVTGELWAETTVEA